MRKQLAACTLIVAVLGGSVATPALAQGRGRGRGEAKQDQKDAKQDQKEVRKEIKEDAKVASRADADRDVPRYGFPSRERDIISRYYAQRASGLPPGLAKRKGDLPPGLEKQLQRNGTLPPGLQKRIQPFPADLRSQLGPLPAGYSRAVVDGDVIVYRTSTRQIVDVIHDIVR
jgi:hypothetical protein